ncbi:MAG: hypothetical protein KC549_01945, partial [Myxococcales bacterium]|nr:hypothetical protein [Myxococcales bacterium]
MMREKMTRRLGLLLLLAPAGAWAQAQLIDGLGGPAGYGENLVPAGDETSTGLIDLRAAFPTGLRLLGQARNNFFINVNGAVSFDGPVAAWPNADLTASPFPLAAPMWSDVDTRNGNGNIWYDIALGRTVVTWDQVGRFDQQAAPRNTYQLVINDRRDLNVGDFDVQFRYSQCGWFLADGRPGNQPARQTVRVCGNSGLPIQLLTDLPVLSSCEPDDQTQAMIITRTGRGRYNDAVLRNYAFEGGQVITEFSI